MNTYTVLYAEDVPHYGFHDIEAEDDQAAIEAACRSINPPGTVPFARVLPTSKLQTAT